MRHVGAVALVMALAATSCANDDTGCTAPVGIYRVEWMNLPPDCRPVERIERLWVDADGDCAGIGERMGTCSLSLGGYSAACAIGLDGGLAQIFARLARSGEGRFEGEAEVSVGDFLRDFRVDGGAYRECEPARIAVVYDGDGPMPEPAEDPAGGRGAGDSCLATCDPGLVCAQVEQFAATGHGRCAEPPGAGAACALSVHADRPPLCADGTYCDGESTCAPLPEAGEACGTSIQVGAPPICLHDAYCDEDGVCRDHPTLGEPCVTDWGHASVLMDCAAVPCCREDEGYCDVEAPGEPTCAPWLTRGDPCRDGTFPPYADDCAPELACECHDADCVCVEYRDPGESCDDSTLRCTSLSTGCVDGICR
jgi:hypothetical protein